MWKLVCLAILSCNVPAPAASPHRYEQVRENLEARRVKLARDLETEPARAIAAARVTLIEALRDELLPAWNGTAWAMNGTSQTPHEGSIACGYFVSTTLLHAGFRVERRRLGQQASTFITRSLVSSEPIWQTSDQPIDAFVDRVRKSGDGIYLVGLDSHVGFIIVDGKHTWFHHSGPGEEGVRREPARTASFLSPSRYRQVGKLFDDALVEKWLRGDAIATVLPRR